MGNSARSFENYNELHILTTNIEDIFFARDFFSQQEKMKE